MQSGRSVRVSMGLFGTPADQETAEAKRKHRDLVKKIAGESEVLSSKTKLLLLDPSRESDHVNKGRRTSTIFKQMNIINASGYSESELKQFRSIIHRKVLDAIKVLIKEAHARDVALLDENRGLADAALLWSTESLSPATASTVAKLWADPGIKQVFELRAEYQLSDQVAMYLDDVMRIGAADYSPTTGDALRARVRTSGVASKEFVINKRPYVVWDVGGQRSELSNWLPFFTHVTAIVFVIAMGEYDQVVKEDPSKNRLEETLELFSQVCNSPHVGDTDILVYFNKKDIFADKIERIDPGKFFPECTGGCDYKVAEAFFKKMFRDRVQDKKRMVYMHTTDDNDSSNRAFIFDAVTDILLNAAYQTTHQMEGGMIF